MVWIYRLVSVAVILVILQALLFKIVGLKSVSCKRWFSCRYAFEGDEIFLLEEIKNDRPFPVPLLVIESRIDRSIELSSATELDANEANYHRSIFSLLPFSKIVRKHRIKLSKRGYYDLKSMAVSGYDLLGFLEVSMDHMPLNGIVTVYPSLLDTGDIQLPCHSFLGDAVVRRWIVDDPFLNAGVRAYLPTDPLKSVNWNASARTGTLQVNKHDYSANTKLLVLFNVDLSENQWGTPVDPARLEYALSLCATIVKLAIEKSMDVAFMSNGSGKLDEKNYSEIASGSGEQHLYTILEALALLTFNHVFSFRYFLGQLCKSGIHDTDVLIITNYVDSEMEECVKLLQYSGNAVEILVPGGGAYET